MNDEIVQNDAPRYTILDLPKTVGSYKFGHTVITTCTKRPRWMTRLLMKWLVEWEWEDKV